MATAARRLLSYAQRAALCASLCASLAASTTAQVAQFKVVSPDVDDDYVGTSMDVDGTRILYNGRASAFLLDVITGEQREFAGPPSDPAYGVSVALDGDYVAVGNWAFDGMLAGQPLDASGAVDLYSASTGALLHRLEASDRADIDQFGCAVDISGDTVVVGAWGDDDRGNFSGSAYVFDAVTGAELHKLTASNGDPSDAFGLGVAVDGDLAIIGAQAADFMGSPEGAAYVYDVTTGAELSILFNPESTYANDIGISVAIDGNVALIGNRGGKVGTLNSAGKGFLFNATTGALLQTLEADVPVGGEGLGEWVTLSDGVAVLSAPDADVGPIDRAGHVVLFDTTTGDQLADYTAEDVTAFASFGEHMAMDGELLLCAADRNANSWDGVVYVFDRQPDTWYSTGAGRAGSGDVPALSATGDLTPSSQLTVELSGGLPFGSATLVLGLEALSLPAKQTVLVPSPDVLLAGLPLDADGDLSLPTHWPAGFPSGFRVLLQAWLPDPGAVQGLAASNGVAGFTP